MCYYIVHGLGFFLFSVALITLRDPYSGLGFDPVAVGVLYGQLIVLNGFHAVHRGFNAAITRIELAQVKIGVAEPGAFGIAAYHPVEELLLLPDRRGVVIPRGYPVIIYRRHQERAIRHLGIRERLRHLPVKGYGFLVFFILICFFSTGKVIERRPRGAYHEGVAVPDPGIRKSLAFKEQQDVRHGSLGNYGGDRNVLRAGYHHEIHPGFRGHDVQKSSKGSFFQSHTVDDA